MYFVKAGFRTLSLHHLILVEDGAEEPAPKAIPGDALRATMTNGRVLDFEGHAAEVLRRQMRLVTVTSPDVSQEGSGAGADAGADAGAETEVGGSDRNQGQADIQSHPVGQVSGLP